MATQPSNKILFMLASGDIDFDSDTFKIILMQSGFTYNPDTHEDYADVSANELATANGYTAGGATLAGVSVTENDSTNTCDITWNDASWTASGGSLVASGAIIYDDTTTVPADAIVGYIDFGGDQTTLDGGTFTITNIEVELGHG
jgi:hypothetical protein